MGCSYLSRKEGDLHCHRVPANLPGPLPSLNLRAKILSAVLPGRVQDGSQGVQLHVRTGDLQEASVPNKASAETAE